MIQPANGKAVLVRTNSTALRDPKRTRDLRLFILREKIDSRNIDVTRHTGREGVVVCKELVEESHLVGESFVKLRINNTAFLAENAGINLRTPHLCLELKASCAPDATYSVIIEHKEVMKGSDHSEMFVIMSAATTRTQTLHETHLWQRIITEDHPEDVPLSDLNPRREDDGERDEPRGRLRKRAIVLQSNLGVPREDSGVALQCGCSRQA
ncbi:hypothetical protein PoB_005903800 [Plakobranchus ocellatus]|uniref:Uncharacterized protein n=1 Tax=Plakobranchus ocellatus TaxID=259542 RepID=A0AAV4CMJ4_9GAST|nr:hypothetical protein PoB_005903800 [Plakobranchus ocellatus]